MDVYAAFGSNKTKEIEGVVFYLDLEKTAWVKLARYNNPKMREFTRQKMLSDPTYRRAARGSGANAGEMIDHLTMEAIVETVILDWGGLRERGSKKLIPYSKENAARLCADLPDFLDFVSDACQNLAAYQDADEEDAEGNSAPSLSGSESGATAKTG